MENEYCILLNELYIIWIIIICYIKEKLNVIYCFYNVSGLNWLLIYNEKWGI